jgi:hypothetical protein
MKRHRSCARCRAPENVGEPPCRLAGDHPWMTATADQVGDSELVTAYHQRHGRPRRKAVNNSTVACRQGRHRRAEPVCTPLP